MSKKQYKVRNRQEYNQSLVNRGSVFLWFDEKSLNSWHSKEANKRGRPQYFSDFAIECALSIAAVYNLTLRATQGFLQSIIFRLGLPIDCPHYSTLSRRRKQLNVHIPSNLKSNEPIHIAVDSTGLRVYGEGEWKVRQHGADKRRTWRKLHLAIDTNTHEIAGVVLSTNDFHDSEMFSDLMEQVSNPIGNIYADGGYDTHDVNELIIEKGGTPVIPTRHNAVIAQHGNSRLPPKPRDETLRAIKRQGREKWKQTSNYHQRSFAETAMYRFKQLVGGTLRSRSIEAQAAETFIKCKIINKVTALGMPDGYMVAA